MNEQNTLTMIALITDTHPDRQYLNDDGQPQRCTGCNELVFWTDIRGWSHHRNNRSCWINSQEQK